MIGKNSFRMFSECLVWPMSWLISLSCYMTNTALHFQGVLKLLLLRRFLSLYLANREVISSSNKKAGFCLRIMNFCQWLLVESALYLILNVAF